MTSKINPINLSVFLIILIHSTYLSKLIYFPYPEFFIFPYLIDLGLTPYTQVVDHHFPGLMLLPINFKTLGMTSIEISKLWLAGLVCISHIFIFLISKKIFNHKFIIIPNILYLVLQPFFSGWIFWLDSFIPTLTLILFYFIIIKNENTKRWLLFLGILSGTTILFKQTAVIMILVLCLYLFFRKKILWYFLGLTIMGASFLLYLLVNQLFIPFFYWTVLFNLTIYPKMSAHGPTTGELVRVLSVFGLALTSLAFIQYKKIKTNTIFWLVLFFLTSLIGISSRFDFVHFQPALPYAILLLTFVISKIYSKKIGLLAIACYLIIFLYWQIIFIRGHISNQVILYDKSVITLTEEIKKRTKKNDPIFLTGVPYTLYLYSETRPAGNYFIFQLPWLLYNAENEQLKALESEHPKLIVIDKSNEINGKKLTEFSPKIIKFIDQNYQTTATIQSVEIMEPKNEE